MTFQLSDSWGTSKRINENRQESFESWADKTRHLSEKKRSDNIVRLLQFPETSPTGKIELINEYDYTHNMIMTNGKVYYATLMAGDPPVIDYANFGRLRLGNNAGAAISKTDTYTHFSSNGSGTNYYIDSSDIKLEISYPSINDTNTHNTGRGTQTVSYDFHYGTSSQFTNIISGCIHGAGTTALPDTVPVDNTPLLCRFNFANSFSTTSGSSMMIFVNHRINDA